MLTEYYFEIEHVKGLNNAKTDALSRKEELQRNNKMSGALFKESSNEKIRYNHPQLSGIHKALKSLWEQQIRKVQETDPNYKDYKGREMQLETMYILSEIAEEFVIEFYKGII